MANRKEPQVGKMGQLTYSELQRKFNYMQWTESHFIVQAEYKSDGQ